MSWKKVGGIDYSQYTNNIHSNISNFTNIETLKINSNNTTLHVGSNVLRLGNNTGETSQVNSLWFAGIDLDDNISTSVEIIPKTSLEERCFRSEYIGDSTNKELFIYKGDVENDRIRLKSSQIVFDTYEKNLNNQLQEDRFDENIRMIINSEGNVGLNTLTPRTKLDIQGQLLSGYGNGINGGGLPFIATGETITPVTNGYYFCGKLNIAYDFSKTQSANNNSKLKIEVFGGDLDGSTGMGTDIYVLSNNYRQSYVTNSDNVELHSVIFKTSYCGGAGTGENNDLYSICIYRCEDGTDDVYVYVNGQTNGVTLNIRAFMLSTTNFSENLLEEQEIILQYSGGNGVTETPSSDNNIKRIPVYGKDTNAETGILYIEKFGFIEKYNNKFGIGSNTFNSDVNYGSISSTTDISIKGNTLISGNTRIDEHMYVGGDLTLNGHLYINGEMTVNSVIMQNFQILEKAYIGAGLRLNSDQVLEELNTTSETVYNQNFIIFDNTTGSKPTTIYQITQIDDYIGYKTEPVDGVLVSGTINKNILTVDQNINNETFNQDDVIIVEEIEYTIVDYSNPSITLNISLSKDYSSVTILKKKIINYQYDYLTIGQSYDNYFENSDICIKPNGSTSSFIGMGTTNPQNNLDVKGSLCIGEDYAGSLKAPSNGALIQGSVGIGTSVFPDNSITTCRISGSCVIGEDLSNINTYYPNMNSTMIQGSLGIGVLENESLLDVGGSISFGDGSKQSFALTFLGSRTNGLWNKMGSKETTTFINNPVSGYSITNDNVAKYVVDINNNGNIIAIGTSKATVNVLNDGETVPYEDAGSVSFYLWSGMKWNNFGNTIGGNITNKDTNNNYVGERFGTSISINGDGHRFIAGAPYYCGKQDNVGKICIYDWVNGEWSCVYEMYGEDENSFIGTTVTISKNGKYALVGGLNINYIYFIYFDDNTFKYDKIINLKEELDANGNAIEESNDKNFGSSLFINRDGIVMLVGSSNASVQYNDKIYNSGCVYGYTRRAENNKFVFDNNYYVKLVSPIAQNNQYFGSSISSNSIGTRYAIGSPFTNFNDGDNIGMVVTYEANYDVLKSGLFKNNTNSNFVNLTGQLYGKNKNQKFGSSVKLNGSGDYLIVSSSGNSIDVNGKINMYHYESTLEWIDFSSTYIEVDSYNLPATSIGVSSDSMIVVYGYDQKWLGPNYKNYNCAEVIRLGVYENSISSEIVNIKNNLGIGINHPEASLDIVSDEYKDIIKIKANKHPDEETAGNNYLSYYEGGIQIKNDFTDKSIKDGGETSYYLYNLDTIISNKKGSFIFNYGKKFEICEKDEEMCTVYINKKKFAVNHNNPEASLDVKGTMIVKDDYENKNMLITTNIYKNTLTGKHNIGLGSEVLNSLKSGSNNLLFGHKSGHAIEDGNNNVCIGSQTLSTSNASNNVAVGFSALKVNRLNDNTAIGNNSLKSDIYGIGNTAIGANTDVDQELNCQYSTAIGYNAIIGKSNAIIMGDSNDEKLCVGIGTNKPLFKLDVTGDGNFSGKLSINDQLQPLGGIYVENTINMDTETKEITFDIDIISNMDASFNNLTIIDYCRPNGGININDNSCILTPNGYATFGKESMMLSTNKNNPLVIINGFTEIKSDIDVTGTISADRVQTNSLIFIDLFEPNGGIAMFPESSNTDYIFYVEKNTGNTTIRGTLEVDDKCVFNDGFTSGTTKSSSSIFNNNVIMNGSLQAADNNTTISENNVKLGDGNCSIQVAKNLSFTDDITDDTNNNNVSSNGIIIDGTGRMEIKSGISVVTIDSELKVDKISANTFTGGGTVPPGGIIMWSGSQDDVPNGWQLCNGQGRTPDLRGRFIMSSTYGENVSLTNNIGSSEDLNTGRYDGKTNSDGSSNTSYKKGDYVGGYSNFVLQEVNIPSHSHPIEDINHDHTGLTQNHTHSIPSDEITSGGVVNAYGYEYGPSGNGGSIKLEGDNDNNLQPLNSLSGRYSISTVIGQPQSSSSVFAITLDRVNGAQSNQSAKYDELVLESQAPPTDDIKTGIENPSFTNTTTNPVKTNVAKSGINTTETWGGKSDGTVAHENKPQYYVLAFIMRSY